MQALGTEPVNNVRSAGSYVSMATTTFAAAVPELKPVFSASTTVQLSEEAKDRFVANQDRVDEKTDESGKSLSGFFQAVTDEAEVQEGTDQITDTIERLQEMLEEAIKRLKFAQQQLALATMELRNSTDEAQKMAALQKVQAAQLQVLSVQGEVLVIHERINQIISEQQKAG